LCVRPAVLRATLLPLLLLLPGLAGNGEARRI
jgi:hypothetical protein